MATPYQGHYRTNQNEVRLDASESIWFKRELEFIDQKVYEQVYPENRGRSLVPTQEGVPDWAPVYTWSMYERVGKAQVIGQNAQDLPRADVFGTQGSKIIKVWGLAYAYNIFEIKAAAATGKPLESERAKATRYGIETAIDEVLAVGLASHGLEGLLNLSNTTAYTVPNGASGSKLWATKTPDEISRDVGGAVSAAVLALKASGGQMFMEFTLVLPVTDYLLIAQTRMGDGSNLSILQYVLQNNPFVKEITHWHRCANAGTGGSVDRAVLYPKNPNVIAGIVPMEFTPQPAEQRGLEYVVNCVASSGGVVCRYPIAVVYLDGISAGG